MIFIPHNVPSSKNSKIKGKFFSKTVQKYLRKHGIQHFSSHKKTITPYKTIPMTFPFDEISTLLKGEEYPILLGFHFVRDSKRSFDFHNVCQIIFDIMVAGNVIEDDDSDHVLPFPMMLNNQWYKIDRDSPGVYINVLNDI